MFALNFKKEWKMHKSLLITFFLITVFLFSMITVFYFILKYAELNDRSELIFRGIWAVLAGLSSTLATILPIVLMYKVLKNDLGKNNVHYTIFTPQPVISWYLPKVLFIFIVQGLFAIISLGYAYFILDVTGSGDTFNVKENILAYFVSTFAFGTFALLTLCMALYYSFRKKGISWMLIVFTIIGYFTSMIIYSIIDSIQNFNNENYEPDMIKNMLIQSGIDSFVGLVFIVISLYLFSKKIEY